VSRATSVATCLLAALLASCDPAGTPAAERARREETLLLAQVAQLQEAIARVEDGRLVTRGRVAVGVTEDAVAEVLAAALPRELRAQQRLFVRFDKARAVFRGNTAALVFEAEARDLRGGRSARAEVVGRLASVRVERGRLTADVELVDFEVLDTTIDRRGSAALERLIRQNSAALAQFLPGLDFPVRLEQAIEFEGLREGVVRTRAGRLPLTLTVAEVLPLAGTLWAFVDVEAGSWEALAGDARRGTP
jgi:hypothetical protein